MIISGPKQPTNYTVLQFKRLNLQILNLSSPTFAPCFYVTGIQIVDFRLAATCDLLASGLINLVLKRIIFRHAVAVSNLVS